MKEILRTILRGFESLSSLQEFKKLSLCVEALQFAMESVLILSIRKVYGGILMKIFTLNLAPCTKREKAEADGIGC